eukprot:scaffold147896_cov20-Tisochrysis_lutea.AAC.1
MPGLQSREKACADLFQYTGQKRVLESPRCVRIVSASGFCLCGCLQHRPQQWSIADWNTIASQKAGPGQHKHSRDTLTTCWTTTAPAAGGWLNIFHARTMAGRAGSSATQSCACGRPAAVAPPLQGLPQSLAQNPRSVCPGYL